MEYYFTLFRLKLIMSGNRKSEQYKK